MKKYLLLLIIFGFSISQALYAQDADDVKGVYPCFQHGVTVNKEKSKFPGQCYPFNFHFTRLYEGTYSFRNSSEGDSLAGFYNSTSWVSDDYTQGHIKYVTPNKNEYRMNYRLRYPESYNMDYEPGFPLLVMFHGAGETGNCWPGRRDNSCKWGGFGWNAVDNDPQAGPWANPKLLNNDINLLHGGKPNRDAVNLAGNKLPNDPTLDPKAFPGLVFFPQNLNGWTGEVSEAIKIIYNLLKEENIDPNRVYIYGLSNGAASVVTALKTDPSLFAATILMSPTGANVKFQQDTAVSQMPLWIFQGGKDSGPSPQQTETLIRWFEQEGGISRYTLYPGLGHGTWNTALKEDDFYSWLLAQSESNIHVYYADSSICATNGKGPKLGVRFGFADYEWQKDGALIAGANGPVIHANEPGVYRARFKRYSSSENPLNMPVEWNEWSPPVTIEESISQLPVVTVLGSRHLPDINESTSVILETEDSPTSYFHWSRNSTALPDTANYITASTAGVYGLTTETFGGCPSEPADDIYVTVNAPQTLTAPDGVQAQPVSSGAVQLFWTDNSSNETGFEIYRATNPAGPYTFVSETHTDAVGYKDTGLESNETYYYRLRAVNNSSVSPYTENVTTETEMDTEKPSPPSNLVSTGHTLNTISLSWDAATDNTGIQQYHIYYGGSSIATGNNNTVFDLEDLTPNTAYVITVKAEDFDGNLSYASNQISVSTIVSGLTYQHTTGAWSSLDSIDNWDLKEYSGHVDKVTITGLYTQEDLFNFKFDGYIYITDPGNYKFRSYSDDGSRVYINGFDPAHLVFDNDGAHGPGYGSDTPEILDLDAGFYPITVTFFEIDGGQTLLVDWSGPDTGNNWEEISPSAFKSGDEIPTTPPDVPTNLTASATGMSSIHLDWDYTGDNIEDLNVVVLGSSTAEGTGASAGNSWVELLDTWLGDNFTNHTLTNLALGGFTTEDVRATGSTPAPDATRNITAALAEDPDVIIINLPSNDTNEEIPVETSMDYFREIQSVAAAQGVKVYITTTQPRNFGGDQIKRDLLQVRADSIRNAFGENVIDIYDYLTDFSDNKKIKSEFNFDGTHVNDDGHAYIFSEVQAKMSELLTNFEIYRALTSGGVYNIVGQTLGGELTFDDEDLLPNTTYYYKLKSINSNGSSGFSSGANATTGTDTEAPTAPSGLTIVSSSNNNVGFSWTASTDNVAVTGYEIFANDELIGTSDVVTFTHVFAPEETYDVKVKAYDASDNKSGYSNIVNFSVSGSTITFYSQANGSIDDLTTWGTSVSGGGDHPLSFDYNGQSFVIANRTSSTLDSDLAIGGPLSKIIVGEGVTLTLNAELTGNIAAEDNAIINVDHDYNLTLVDLSPLSTVNYNTYSNVAQAAYGNLNLNGSGTKNFATGVTSVTGDLTVASGVGLKGTPGNSSAINLAGNLTLTGSAGAVTADTRVSLTFSNTGTPSTVTVYDDIDFYGFTTTQGDIEIDNQAAEPINITLGSDNGGGLMLADNSSFMLHDNHLAIAGNGAINPGNSTGKVSVTGGNINIASGTGMDSHLYLDDVNNTVTTFTTDLTGADISVHGPMDLTDGIKIINGTVNSNGNIRLKSTVQATANIKAIENGGSLLGDVIVERYIASIGRNYRYLSSPVTNATVSDWQAYIPVTGTFSGASTGSGLGNNPSMYYYDEPNGGYQPYPAPTGTNTAPLEIGRGYAVYVRKVDGPTTLVTEGEANQGDIGFTLTGGTGGGANDGWNLVGNPYASDIVWDQAGWQSSGVGDVISIRSNNADGTFQYMTWDRQSDSGQLEDGKIPAGQAFWVQTVNGSPTLTVTESAKTGDIGSENTEFYRKAGKGGVNYAFSIHLSDGEYEDYALVKFRPEGENTYNKLKDGAKRFNSFFNMSTLSSENIMLAVNDLSDEFCSQSMTLSLTEGKDEGGNIKSFPTGVYHFSFGNIEAFDIATIQLIDSLEDQTITVNSSTDYQFNVDTENPETYKDRFYLNIIKTEIALDKTLNAPMAVCTSSGMTAIDILDSQPGVQYTATINNGTTISEAVIGNGEDLSLNIESALLSAGENQIRIKAVHAGCTPAYLSEDLNVVLSTNPVTTVENDLYSGCFGGKIDIKADGAGTEGSYKWYDEDRALIEGETGDILTARKLGYYDIYFVRAVNKYGCESTVDYTSIEIESDSLAQPVIAFENGLLKTNMTADIQWYFNDAVIEGANSNTYLPEQSGIYAVSSSNGVCRKSSENFEYVITDIFKPVGDEEFSLVVYPNPSKDYNFNIKGNADIQSKIHLNLLDVTGRVKLNKIFSASDYQKGISIELEEKLPAGVYIVQIGQAGKLLQKKLIIE